MVARRALALAAVAAASLIVLDAAHASGGAPLRVEVAPKKLETEVAQPKNILLVASNASDSPITQVHLTWFTNGAAKVHLGRSQTPRLRTLPAHTDRSWALRVAPARAGAPNGTVFFRIAYRVGKRSARTRRIAMVPLEVKVGSQSVGDVVSASLKTSLEALDEQHPGTVYLIVTNKSSHPVRLLSIDETGPDSVEFDDTTPRAIPARRQISIDVGVHAKNRVEPGKHLLVFDLEFSWGSSKAPRVGHLIETTTTQVGVLGESAVLTLLGVPSFLLLPGFLVLAVVAIGWRLRRPTPASNDFPFGVKDPEFWVVAVTLSIALALLWPRVGGHSYLRTYGLRDVISLWLVSLLIGAALYGLIFSGSIGLHTARTPRSTDDQVAVLRKLAWQRLGLERQRFRFGDGAGIYWGYLVQRRDGMDSLWLAPPISVTVRDPGQNAGPDAAEKAAALLKQLQDERSPWQLAKLLKQHRSGLDIAWERGGGPGQPYMKKKEEMANEENAQRIVSVQ